MASSPREIGHLIRDAREARGWSQIDLAREVSVHENTISSWENGRFQRIEHRNRERLSDVLDLPMEKLVTDDDDRPAPTEVEEIAAAIERLAEVFRPVPAQLRDLQERVTALEHRRPP